MNPGDAAGDGHADGTTVARASENASQDSEAHGDLTDRTRQLRADGMSASGGATPGVASSTRPRLKSNDDEHNAVPKHGSASDRSGWRIGLRARLHAYLVCVHVLGFGAALYFLRNSVPLFIGLEMALALSLALGIRLVHAAMRPLEYTARFRDLVENEDYASRLTDSKLPELDQLISLFNGMLGTLYRERLALGEQRGFLDSLLQATPSAVLVFDFEGRINLMNTSAHALLGFDDPIGKTLRQLASQGLAAQLDTLALNENRLLSDAEGRRFRAQRGQFHDRGFARSFLIVDEMTDVLESSERATYDKLIRVLAHEVNNTVGATASVLDSLLFYQSQLTERDASDFSTAIVAVRKRNVSLADFIERFTRVVKMPVPELRSVCLAAMMDDIIWLHREQCSSRSITIGWRRRDELPGQMLDPQLMEQAMVNIVKNAVEAVGERGSIHIELVRENDRIRLSVLDSGNRLGELPARQLFAPFATTKKGGQGIGLMFVREVLERHGLTYRLASNAQAETQFDIWFPAASAARQRK